MDKDPLFNSKEVSRQLLDTYFRTVEYPYTKHHIDSYDTFLKQDVKDIITANNPILILKDLYPGTNDTYKYKIEIYIGGETGESIEIGTPTINHEPSNDIRILYPNEARLRNLTYGSMVYVDIIVKISYIPPENYKEKEVIDLSPPVNTFTKWPLFMIPIMVHSSYCILHNKPKDFLKLVGECQYDNGGYFIVDGSEKVLITHQKQAFNTLYITPQNDPKISVFASIQCLSPKSGQVKRVVFTLTRHNKNMLKNAITHETIQVTLPFVRNPIPLFILFRAIGFETDEEIIKLIFPNLDDSEAKLLLPKLHPSIIEGYPFFTTYNAIQYIKTLTKGFSVEHVIDIIRDQMFIHMPNDPMSQGIFLGTCVRKILRVSEGYDLKTDRDDIRNQRCLTSGFLIQELFTNSYKLWKKAFCLAIDKEYNYNKTILYAGENFRNIFTKANEQKIFLPELLRDMILKGFKGKWSSGMGEDNSGVLQALSRLSYTDFMSHCRRVILEFDTSMKLTGPRKLHTTQYGYFCTSETPTGSSIGITKNLSIMTAISTSTKSDQFIQWLHTKGRVYKPDEITVDERYFFVPIYLNGGIIGYSETPNELTLVLKLFKRTGCLPYSTSISFSIRDRIVYIYMDAGRPLRPLMWLPAYITDSRQKYIEQFNKTQSLKTWKNLVLGTMGDPAVTSIHSTSFIDPKQDEPEFVLREYITELALKTGIIEYIDPYEQNETYIANFPDEIRPETTHIELHPSTILSMMTSMIPFAHHNQSPRNQLSCSQSKQGISVYATNWRNRFDNTAHVLCYGEMPLVRTMYNNYLGEGNMVYGMNCILAIACWSGYNQEDGIVMNLDAINRGMFRTIAYRSYEAYEEDDEKVQTRVRFANPISIPQWTDLRPGADYSKLDENGIIREGEYVDENTVIIGAYVQTSAIDFKDASTCPQVWTKGRVEKIAVMMNNKGLRLIKIRIVQDRIPELGDKFCLSPDHEVLTEEGWIPITEITTDHKVLQRTAEDQRQFVNPTDIITFDYEDTMYEVQCNSGELPLLVSPQHRLVGMFYDSVRYQSFITEAQVIANDVTTPYYQINENNMLDRITNMVERKNPATTIHCLTVPSSVFMVRRMGATYGYWTGNSNRHGQKGTIGALLRGYDMPRTQSGIVPDMIMNPHAIPSRMTIAQNLEQLLGKAGLQMGAFGDGTAFMNSESPQEEIGEILEKTGFEKYGNEVMYNGATGEQIPVSIFIGPVYGMRLKHMVEDKWQARNKGRKEVRTHQPTGGRGAQGGLKIGEMDRDAIIGHATSAFFKEAFMERSDGVKMPICVSCGTVPIYNPRLNIVVCSLCDGPLQYIGTNNVNTIELLPPLGRPKAKIVQVEMPYSTKLFAQEQETFLNLSMRFITTSGVEKLRSLGRIDEVDESRELKPLEYSKPVHTAPFVRAEDESVDIPAILQSIQETKAAMSQPIVDPQLEELPPDVSAFIPGPNQGQSAPVININVTSGQQQPLQQMNMPQDLNMSQPNTSQPNISQGILPQGMPPQGISSQPLNLQQPQQPDQSQPLNLQQPIPQPLNLQQPPQPQQPLQSGGMLYPSGTYYPAGNPSSAPIISIDTGMQAFQQDGINFMGGRPIRRRSQMGGYQMNQGFSAPGSSMGPSSSSIGANSIGTLVVTKLE